MLLIEERVAIPTAAEPIEGHLVYPNAASIVGRVLLSCPHPLLGGQIDNPVVTALAHCFANAGAVVLVYKYRQEAIDLNREVRGAFWEDHRILASTAKDIDDAQHCLAWLRSLKLPGSATRTALAGYSYGGAISILIGGELHVLAISPPLKALDKNASIRWEKVTIVRAENDFALSGEECDALQRLRDPTTSMRVVAGADHFFQEQLPDVTRIAAEWISAQMSFSPQASNLL